MFEISSAPHLENIKVQCICDPVLTLIKLFITLKC